MNKTNLDSKILLLSCNWHAYHSLETAGINKESYSGSFYPIRLSCLGRVTHGMILKAFEKGADGVFLLGCPEGECQYQTGSSQVQKVFLETQILIKTLGYAESQLGLEFIQAGDSEKIIQSLEIFINGIRETEGVG